MSRVRGMERYTELKLLLKSWETKFLKENQRKPSKGDVERAPEDVRGLYREFSSLKKSRHSSGSAPCGGGGAAEPGQEESDAWGNHLNRGRGTPELTPCERRSLKASAQFYGMKLKANLGGAVKSRPLSLKKPLTPHIAAPSEKMAVSPDVMPASSAALFPPHPEEDPGRVCRNTGTPSWGNKGGTRLQQLRAQVGQRLSSLDHNWLERCDLEPPGKSSPCRVTGHREAAMAGEKGEADMAGERGEAAIVEERLEAGIVKEKGEAAMAGERGKAAIVEERLEAAIVKEKGEAVAGPDTGRLCCSEGGDPPYSRGFVEAGRSRRAAQVGNGVTKASPGGRKEGREWQDDKMERSGLGKKKKTPDTSDLPPGGNPAPLPVSWQDPYREGSPIQKRGGGMATITAQQEGRGSGRKSQRREPSLTPEKRSRQRGHKKPKLDDDEASRPELCREMTENILGEVMEEADQRVTARTLPRAPARRTENFVRLNLKKKSHVKNVLNGSRLRRQMWKQKWQKKGERFGGGGGSEDICFNCGRTGHWAARCPGKVIPAVPDQLPQGAQEEEPELPTLQDVARMTNTQLSTAGGAGEVWPAVERPVNEAAPPPPAMKPLYEPDPSGDVPVAPPEVYEALAELGYRSFRPGQEAAIMRILSGLSSLVILSTGMGKSLCYQLPAYLYAMRSPCVTLVISPLVSLMDDQVSALPPKLRAVCVHSNMTRSQRQAAMDKVKRGEVHVVLLSPEALVGGGQSGYSCLPPADQLPPVAFACIDEVHCVSEWSHNFRPCYLRLCKVLRERLGVRCLLGLTATATLSTAQDVARHLGASGDLQERLAAVPPNLHLSVSMDRDRDQALVTLLKGERFGCLDSIIVYCTRREESQRLAALLRTCLQGVTVKKAEVSEETAGDRKKRLVGKKVRRPLRWVADCYHAGLSAAERRRVQNNFMSGQLRIVTATVAFGMGLDKSDVRGIVHYNMPKNFESYVQEIGRAGRDARDAHCHLFLDSQDLAELRRHVYADSVDHIAVKKLVQRVLPGCHCRDIQQKREALSVAGEVSDEEMVAAESPDVGEGRLCRGHERVLPVEETVRALDLREEGIETLLCYLELHPSHWLELLHPTLSSCRLTCYSGPQQLRQLAHSCPPVAVALARERVSGVERQLSGSLEFDVVELADSMGWESLPVKRALRDLQWGPSGGVRGMGRSGVLVEFSKLCFHFLSCGDLTNEELEEVCHFLHHKVTSRESAALRQLSTCYRVFHSVAYRSSQACAERVNLERSAQLKTLILQYFQGAEPLKDVGGDCAGEQLCHAEAEEWRTQVSSDVRLLLSIHQEERFTGRAIARIFHGIGSPCYPAQVFGRDRRFWRKYLHLDFTYLMTICREEIIRLR